MIGIARYQRNLVTELLKLWLKKSTNIIMPDLPTSDIKKTIELAVAEALRARNKLKNKFKKPAKKGEKTAPFLRV